MQNVLKHGAALLRRVIWLGMGLQVILGLIWMLNNMGIEHSFGVDWSSGGPVDRPFMQWGVLYPFIVGVVRGMAQWLHVPYYSIVYCLQLVAALGSGCFLLKQVTGWVWYVRLGVSMILISIPMAMQSHLAVLPYSLGASVILLELAFVAALWKQQRWYLRGLLPAYFCWLMEMLILPEYLWLGGIPLLVASIRYLWQWRKEQCTGAWAGLVVIGSILCIMVAGGVWQHKSETYLDVRQMLAARCIWSNLYEVSGAWPMEVKEQIDGAVLRAACDNPEVFYKGFFSCLEELPKTQEKEYLRMMIDSARIVNGKRVLVEIAYDGLGYLMSGVVVPLQLEGKGYISLTGMNYWYFTCDGSSFSRIFMRCYCIWSWLSAVLALVVKVAERLRCGKRPGKTRHGEGLLLLLPGALMALSGAGFYTMSRIGVYDYKILGWWMVIWCIGTLMMAEEKKEDQNDSCVTCCLCAPSNGSTHINRESVSEGI
ncbi:MAG: hypothetical protein IJ327_05995 [Lachnospiraceae bacterium]|nr:hypothetical protein [Lachnospiraceae bacterium]